MSDYGGYQQKRAHALGPFASVYEATAPDGQPGRFALKIFHPPASTSIRRFYAIEGWLIAAERQQRGAKEDGAVLPVVAFGRCPEGAYSVTPWQERTLEPMVDTLAAKGDILRALAECLFNAVEKWGLKPGGSHRKLKASNVFITKSGPLQGMTVILADPWFMYGIKDENAPRTNDLTAIGAILAQVVRRRAVAGWPIEDGPEWRALGHPGKAWLAYCNYLLNPEPKAGELTLAEARKRLRRVPKDARPVRKAMMIGSAATFVIAGSIVAFARFGNPIYMPDNLRRLAETVHNPRAFRQSITSSWADLCHAWDSWLADLQNNAPRLLKTEALWNGRNDPLRVAITNFVANANNLLPGTVVPEAAGEKRLGALGDSPSDAIRNELLKERVAQEVDRTYSQVRALAAQLERWPRWDEMRNLLTLLEAEGKYPRAADALRPDLPPKPGSTGYKLDSARTLKFFNDVSLDETGTLLLASRWGEITKLKAEMEATPDRVQKAMPRIILARLTDHGSVGEFADALAAPLEELRNRHDQYNDPAVERERFLKESILQSETAEVTADDFPRWSAELKLYSKVPPAEDPRLAPALDATVTQLNTRAAGLEADAPAPEPGGPATLNAADFRTEYQQRTADLQALRGRDIVRHDLPQVTGDTNQLAGKLQNLGQRLEATLTLLRPDVWLAKVGRPYGQFEETRQRWTAWQQAALGGVTAEALAQDRARFRTLRAQERQMREWVDGLEGENGFGALKVPDLAGVSTETADALRRLEAARREQAATAIGVIAKWQGALPAAPWSAVGVNERAPLEGHRQWLAALPAFAGDLDQLEKLLTGGFAWREGVSDVVARLAQHPGLDALTGPPAEWNVEAKLLGRLNESNDRAELVGAAQSGGLSRKLTAWRRLGTLSGWPAGAADLDVDGAVVSNLRELVGRDVKDEARRGTLLDELTRETRVRWNRAARNSAASEEQLTAVFERMERYGITEADLEDPALYDLKLWQLKRSDWTEVDLAPLRSRRDAFVGAVRAIKGMAAQPAVASFVDQLAGIELVVDPNRKPTPSPRLAGWQEELTDAGLGLTASWQNGGHTVKLDFSIVQPDDDTPAFYLARRELAVGEFLDLMAGRPKAQTDAVMAALPQWAKTESYSKPYDQPMSWRPRIDNAGRYAGIELNPSWFFYTTAAVKGLLDNTELRATNPALDKAAREKPSLRSPLQQVPPEAARAVAERLIGARLPTPREWEAVMKVVGKPAEGNFRGPDFQQLFYYLRDYNVAGQTVPWRPNAGAFLPKVAVEGSKTRRIFNDDGHAAATADEGRLWFGSVDEGPLTGRFVNLTGNVSIFLFDPAANAYYVAGGSALSPPDIDFTQPQKVEAAGLIGAKPGTEPYSDVGIRPAFEAPPGFRERYKLLVLVREQKYLTW
ncbi:MAG TPA: hypothetical protein VHD61_10080 [Lacunisphaera sp.]|nr:hypothetical protein [Lacunisphaera sp.]